MRAAAFPRARWLHRLLLLFSYNHLEKGKGVRRSGAGPATSKALRCPPDQGLGGKPGEAACIFGFLIPTFRETKQKEKSLFFHFTGVGNTGGALLGKAPSFSSSLQAGRMRPHSLCISFSSPVPRSHLCVLGWLPDRNDGLLDFCLQPGGRCQQHRALCVPGVWGGPAGGHGLCLH